MLLDSFANGNAACYHSTVVSQVKNEQVPFVAEHSSYSKSSLLTDTTICKV